MNSNRMIKKLDNGMKPLIYILGLLLLLKSDVMYALLGLLMYMPILKVGWLISRRRLPSSLWIGMIVLCVFPVVAFSSLRNDLMHPNIWIVLFWIESLASGLIWGLKERNEDSQER